MTSLWYNGTCTMVLLFVSTATAITLLGFAMASVTLVILICAGGQLILIMDAHLVPGGFQDYSSIVSAS